MNNQENIVQADELIGIAKKGFVTTLSVPDLEKVLLGSLSLAKYCYGENSKPFEILFESKKRFEIQKINQKK